jgi:glycolate oxidase
VHPLDPAGSPLESLGVDLDRALLQIDRSCGDGAVVRDPDLLAGYASDESEVAPRVPDALVRVRSAAEVQAALAACYAHDVPVTPRAGGTGRVGGAVPVHGGVVLSVEGMNALKGIDADEPCCVVEAGLITGALHRAVEAEGLFYPPDPNSLDSCAIGGNLACNAGGPRAFKYGVTRDFVWSLEVVLPDGTPLKVGKPTAKGVTGYDLAGLFVGSEGTLGVITEARLKLLPKPEAVATLLAYLPSDAAVGATITGLLRRGVIPRCVELIDETALGLMRGQAGITVPPGATSMLLIEVDGAADALGRQIEALGNVLDDAGALEVLMAQNEGERARLWGARRELSHTLRRSARNKLSEDVVVPRGRVFELLRRCRELAETHGITMPAYGHAGDGNLHVNFLWDAPEQRPAVDRAIYALFESVIALGGTLSGEHGIGVLKAPYLHLEQPPALIALQQRVKAAFDPKGLMNPGKVFLPGRHPHGPC